MNTASVTTASASPADAEQMALDDAVACLGTIAQQLTVCTEGIARLEARPPVDLEMLERGIDQLTKALPPRQPQEASGATRRPWWILPAISTGCLLGGLLAGWQAPRWTETSTHRQVQLLEQMDTVLRQHWSAMPVGVREALTGLYTQAGYQPPTDPKKGK